MINIKDKKYSVLHLSALILCMNIVIFNDFIFKNNLFIYQDIGSDTINSYYPYYLNFIKTLKSGDLSFWLNNLGMGNNILSMGALICDPFALILLPFGEVYLPQGLLVMTIFKIILAGVSFYFYLSNFAISERSKFLGGLLYAFNGYMMLWGQHYQFGTIVVLLPLLALGYETVLKKNKAVILSLSVAMIAFYSLYFLFMASVFLFIYAIFRFADCGEKNIRTFLRHVFKCIFSYLLGIGLSAIIVLPSLWLMLSSPRITDNAPKFPLTQLDTPLYYISTALRIFSNNAMGTGEYFFGYINYYETPVLYSGIITLVMIPIFFKSIKKRQSIIYGIFLGMLVIFLALPHFSAMFNAYRGISYRWTFIIIFVMITAAVIGIDFYEKNNSYKLLQASSLALFSFLMVLLAATYKWMPSIRDNIKISGKFLIISVFFLGVYTVLFKLYKLPKLKANMKNILIFVVAIELMASSYLTVFRNRVVVKDSYFKEKVGYNDYTKEAVDYIKSVDSGIYRIEKNYYSQFLNDNLIQDYYGIKTYNSLNPGPVLDFMKKMEVPFFLYINYIKDFDNRHNINAMSSVKYYLIKGEYSIPRGYEFLSKVGDISIYENKNYLPIGFTYDRYITEGEFLKLSKEERDIQILKTLVVGNKEKNISIASGSGIAEIKDDYIKDIAARKENIFTIESFKNGYVKGNIQITDKDKVLFISIPYDKGWTARVDGNEEPVIKGNIGFMALNLQTGSYSIELKYKQPLFVEGIIVSIISFVLLLSLRWKKVI